MEIHKERVDEMTGIQGDPKDKLNKINNANEGKENLENGTVCEFCHQIFKLSSSCKRHIRVKHLQDLQSLKVNLPKYECDICEKVFTKRKV